MLNEERDPGPIAVRNKAKMGLVARKLKGKFFLSMPGGQVVLKQQWWVELDIGGAALKSRNQPGLTSSSLS